MVSLSLTPLSHISSSSIFHGAIKSGFLFKQLAAERYGVGRQDLRTIKIFLNNYRFSLIKTEPFERHRTAEESYLFMQLPVSTAWMEPPLDYETRLALLEDAQRLANTRSPI